MTSTNQLLGRGAAPYVIEHDGERFEFRALGQAQKSEFRAWLLASAREAIRAVYPEGAERDAEMRNLTREAVSGVYDVFGPVATAAMGTVEGLAKLAAILCGREPAEVAVLFGARQAELRNVLELVMAESMRQYGMTPPAHEGNGESKGGPSGGADAPVRPP